jgi:hypothetical protein
MPWTSAGTSTIHSRSNDPEVAMNGGPELVAVPAAVSAAELRR